MSALLAAFIPGALIGLAAAILLARLAPRTQRAGDALARLDTDARRRRGAAPPAGKGTTRATRIGSWLAAHSADPDTSAAVRIPGFTTPKKDLELIEMSEADFYWRKFAYALTGLFSPVALSAVVFPALGVAAALPLALCPVMALIFWMVPDGTARALARGRRHEFVRFATVYLELVAVAILGESTADSALTKAARVSDSWVFERIQREFYLAELAHASKWQALERLGKSVDVPALGEMARMMRMADNDVGVRKQLRASCSNLRKQLVTEDAMRAEAATNSMQGPLFAMIVPILFLVLIPTALQFFTLNH